MLVKVQRFIEVKMEAKVKRVASVTEWTEAAPASAGLQNQPTGSLMFYTIVPIYIKASKLQQTRCIYELLLLYSCRCIWALLVVLVSLALIGQ